MRFPGGVTLTVHPWLVDATKDAYGNTSGAFGAPVTVPGCAFAPDRSTEPDQNGRRPVLTSGTVYGPLDMPVKPTDEVEIPGAGRFRVIGEVARWSNPFTGTQLGADFAVERVS